MVQQVKDLALLQLCHRLQLWLGFDPWPKYFHMLWVQPKKKKQKPTNFKDCNSCIKIYHRWPNITIF